MNWFYKKINIIKNSFTNITNQPFRFFLTISGIIISSLILSFCYLTLDSYFYHNKNKYSIYDVNNIVFANGNVDKETYENFNNLVNNYNRNIFLDRGKRILFLNDSKNNDLIINTTLYGANENFLNTPIPEFYDTNFLHTPKLIEGRQISNRDIQEKKNVVIIDDILSIQLFGSKNGVGKSLNLDIYDHMILPDGMSHRYKSGVESFEVIGVIEHSKNSFSSFQEFADSTDKHKTYKSIVYIPITYEILQKKDESVFLKENIDFFSVITGVKEIDALNIKSFAGNIYNPGSYLSIEDYTSIMDEINYMVSNSNVLIDIVSIILLVISSFSIFNTLMFSIKEKVSEFGIKKALGAKNTDILFEVFNEGIIFGIIGTIIGIIISSFLVSVFLPTINHYLQSDFEFFISLKTLSFIFILPVLATIISTLPVAIYASNIKIVDALKHE